MPELRRDPIIGRWVIIASERSQRPLAAEAAAAAPPNGYCPFCPGHESATPPEILRRRVQGVGEGTDAWAVRVVPNRHPALRVEGDLDPAGEGVYDRLNGIGAHEVIIETPDHTQELSRLSLPHLFEVVAAYRERMNDLKRDIRLRYAMVFKNHGAAAGATLPHAHSQLIAMPVIPEEVREEMAGARRYHEHRERCLYCDLLQQEIRDGRRLVFQSEAMAVIAPYASRFPFELWVVPRVHSAHFESADDPTLLRLCEALKEALGRLRVELGDPPFNFYVHTAPFSNEGAESYHWHIEIIPSLGTRVAGFELGSGFHINPTPPETAAEALRRVDLTTAE